ncbi:hypothetical protein ACFL2V_00105 [Pseudomonadota bacterium]
MATVFSANKSNVLIDGEVIEGLQSMAFRVATEREYIRAIGSDERIDVNFGMKTVEGEMIVKSTNLLLDGHLQGQTKFQLVSNLKKGDGADAPKRTLSFDDCYVESKSFNMDSGGSPATTYLFSATRVREE